MQNMNKMYGFEGEVKAKYDESMMELFSEVFQALPLGATIGGKVLVVHGGLFGKDGVTLGEEAARARPPRRVLCVRRDARLRVRHGTGRAPCALQPSVDYRHLPPSIPSSHPMHPPPLPQTTLRAPTGSASRPRRAS